MKPAFLDTGYLVALELEDDQHHTAAVTHWTTVLLSRPRLVTTSFVFTETVTFLNRRGQHDSAVRVGDSLLNSDGIELVRVDEPLFQAGWEYFRQHADKRYSLTDCVSFVLMQDRGIRQALAFDRHFEQAGFERLPGEESVQ